MITTEYRYLDSKMNPVEKEKAIIIEVQKKDENGSMLDSKLIILS